MIVLIFNFIVINTNRKFNVVYHSIICLNFIMLCRILSRFIFLQINKYLNNLIIPALNNNL